MIEPAKRGRQELEGEGTCQGAKEPCGEDRKPSWEPVREGKAPSTLCEEQRECNREGEANRIENDDLSSAEAPVEPAESVEQQTKDEDSGCRADEPESEDEEPVKELQMWSLRCLTNGAQRRALARARCSTGLGLCGHLGKNLRLRTKDAMFEHVHCAIEPAQIAPK